MLEVAASPAYKDLMDALGKLAEWSEQAGKGDLPSGQPPEDLVRQFNEALGGTPVEAAQRADAVGPAENAAFAPEAVVPENSPVDIIAESDLFSADQEPVRPADNDTAPQDRLFEEQRREVGDMTEAQGVNLDRGLDALDRAAESRRGEFYRAARNLSEILSKPAAEISPLDLLQAQRLVGVLKVHGESGKKVSEGVSDTLEQLLEQQG